MYRPDGLSRISILSLGLLGSILLVGCGSISLTPMPTLPKAVIEPVKARVGVLLTSEQRNYTHSETRAGAEWTVNLGPAQQMFVREIFGAAFTDVREFSVLLDARSALELQAIFEPKIEQFSFATAAETGGNYVAVTIRMRIDVRAPNGAMHDSLTLTGYGTSTATSLGAGPPIETAAQAAMRDAAAKFLTQFSKLSLTTELAQGRSLLAVPAVAETGHSGFVTIEFLPIRKVRSKFNSVTRGLTF